MPLECAAQTSHEALPKTRRMPISISPSIVSNPVVNAIVDSAIISLCRLSCSFCVLNRFICVECLFLFRFSHQTLGLFVKCTVPARPYTRDLSRNSVSSLPLVASCTALRLPQLVHLGDSLLELDVLALLVAVSLILVKPLCVSMLSLID